MLNDILRSANLYATGLQHVEDRRAQWLEKHKELKTHLKEIADYLDANAGYKQGFYVDTLHAFNEEINGTCADMPSVTFRSGGMPMHVTFKNSLGERKGYTEDGFHITFNPLITGQVIVLLIPHTSDLNKTPENNYTTLAFIDNPAGITMDFVDQVIAKGIEASYHTSFTGIGERPEQETDTDAVPPRAQSPIGFKKYDTTEKVK